VIISRQKLQIIARPLWTVRHVDSIIVLDHRKIERLGLESIILT